jgi:hypothetical protein
LIKQSGKVMVGGLQLRNQVAEFWKHRLLLHEMVQNSLRRAV